MLAGERYDPIFVGARWHSRKSTGCSREESFSPLKNRASGHNHEIRDGEVVSGSFLSPLALTLRKGTLLLGFGAIIQ